MPIHKDILAYNKSQSAADKRICNALARCIDQHLSGAENKIWHAHPVWFLEGNPIVGYSKLKDCVRLLFWSGQSFDESDLKPEGSFQAAEARFTAANQIKVKHLQRWLKKAAEIQWDYKNLVKRKGKLEWLKSGPSKENGSAAKPTSATNDWSTEMIVHIRKLIHQVDPEVVEEVKWRKPSNGMNGVPVWSHHGILCTGETYKHTVKLTFAKGASLPDPAGLFNASLDGNTRRAIDIAEGKPINARAFQALIRAAVAVNTSASATTSRVRSPRKSRRT
jgi:hypothetical protein